MSDLLLLISYTFYDQYKLGFGQNFAHRAPPYCLQLTTTLFVRAYHDKWSHLDGWRDRMGLCVELSLYYRANLAVVWRNFFMHLLKCGVGIFIVRYLATLFFVNVFQFQYRSSDLGVAITCDGFYTRNTSVTQRTFPTVLFPIHSIFEWLTTLCIAFTMVGHCTTDVFQSNKCKRAACRIYL